MGNQTSDDPPRMVLNALDINRQEWQEMTDRERAELANEYVRNAAEAIQPVVDYLKEEVIPELAKSAKQIGDSLLEIDNQIPDGAVNHPDLSVAERQQLLQFRVGANKLRRIRNKRR